MKNILIIILVSIICTDMMSQSEPSYSHFMFNQLTKNPAYAGSREVIHFNGMYRNQWLGIDGAPENFVFNFDTPLFNNKTGLGVSLISDQIGWNKNIYADLSYAYRMRISDKGKLSLGLKARLAYNRLTWNAADPFEDNDDLIPLQDESVVQPNFGVGAFYYTDIFYLGISAPNLLRTSLYSIKAGEEIRYKNKLTYYLNAGATFGKGRDIKFHPSLMLSYNPSAPLELDINAMFIFLDRFWLGFGSRMGDSLGFLTGYQLTRNIRASIGVDATTSRLREDTFGSVELMVEYTFKCCGKKLNNIRYF